MDKSTLQFWGGVVLIAISGLVLFSTIMLETQLSALVLVGVVAGLAIGSLLVGFSRRGRVA